MSRRVDESDWAAGPARFVAAAVLGGAALFGIGRSVFVESAQSPVPTKHEPVTVIPARQAVIQQPTPESARSNAVPSKAAPSQARPADVLSDQATQTTNAGPATVSLADLDASEISIRINVNTASAGELDLLPRIGPVYAQRIVEERHARGPFTSLADLQRVRGIGPKTAEKLAPLVSFD